MCRFPARRSCPYSSLTMTTKKAGLYIHIPFCEKRCFYCDFFSTTDKNFIDNYVRELVNEIKSIVNKNPDYTLTTIYIGGGTPSLLSVKSLGEIAESVYGDFHCEIKEFTIEVNPNSAQNLRFYKDFGINRISLGVQSLNDDILKKIGRLHDAKTAINALDAAANLYENVSADIILGIDENQDVISDAKKMLPYVKHLSAYMLKVEDGTPLQKRLQQRLTSVATEDAVVNQYEKFYKFCMEYGIYRYETSNFARPGFEGKHNSSYWDMSDYFGIGAGAHSFVNGRRYYNKPDLKSYLEGAHSGNGEEITEREYSFSDTIEEFIMLSLRTEKGINISEFYKRFNKDFVAEYGEKLKKTARYVISENGFVRIRPEFMLVQNGIISELL